MIDNPDTAVKYILQNNASISSLLDTYTGTTIPLISGGILPEEETAKKAIIYNGDLEPNNFLEGNTYTLLCTGSTYYESKKIARTVVKQLEGQQIIANGYPVFMNAKIIISNPDPTDKTINTVVELRLFKIGGA